jgi:hypothetical protein
LINQNKSTTVFTRRTETQKREPIMPLYEIQHVTTLTPSEQDSLAEAITQIHSTKFTTPKMFVNVKFTPSSDITTYVGGKRKSGNHILATVRVGASRSQKDFEDLCTEIVKAWERIVPATSSSKGEDRELRSCILMGELFLRGLDRSL